MKNIKWLIVLGLVVVFYWLSNYKARPKLHLSSVELTRQNYSKQVNQICKEMDLPPAYFKALIVLECSGRFPPKSRYERHVYHKLSEVKRGKRKRYGSLTKTHLKKFSDKTLKDLATSWGPLQVMGYQTIAMKIPLHWLKEEFALYYSIKWVKKSYGKYLKKRRFGDAFHIHNTGKPMPSIGTRTYDPNYVKKGLEYIKIFEKDAF
ncbi:hypothetical protein [Microscilla marina]|uniref:Transglycosylase SLT domain-containing protein n=1 Tax=Microscilla marina ATCC 23134 TaxID=313606 RepID=A1ZW45_MICM2|nr:hypothetical protein [Microscilla marina]EAY25408.1 hypothetical protein M23134_06667 [Microscilla marina ATCC 23134]